MQVDQNGDQIMLHFTDDVDHGCFVLEPSGSLSEEDFSALTTAFEAKINATDTIPNLIIKADSFPGWESLAGFLSHVEFLRDHQKLIEKIAFVSDAASLSIGSKVAMHFVYAEIRHFPKDAFDQALAWSAEPPNRSGCVTLMEGLPRQVLGIKASGIISAREYSEVIVPAVKSKLEDNKEVRLLYQLGAEFEKMTAGAAWADARLGVMNLSRFSMIAVVTDVAWIGKSVHVFSPLMPGHVQVFSNADLDAAIAWISAKESEAR